MTLPHSTADADSGDDANSGHDTGTADKADTVSDAGDPTPDAEPTASAANSEVVPPTTAVPADAISLPAVGEPPADGDPDGAPKAESTAEWPQRQSMRKRIGAGWRRRRSIRAKFVLTLLIPGLAVAVLTGGGIMHFASQAAAGGHAHAMTSVDTRASALVTALQAERASTVTMLAGNLTAEDAGFAARRAATDRARSRFTETAMHTDLGGNQRLSSAIAKSVDALKALPTIRTSIENNEVETTEAVQRYTGIIESTLAVPDTAPLGVGSSALAAQLRSAALFAHYSEASATEAHLLY
ncbi:MAG: nitrate- and nitrite sensing domain-containing protein, partial [Mycobacteriales bacterium]